MVMSCPEGGLSLAYDRRVPRGGNGAMANGMRRWLAHIGSGSATIGPKLRDGESPE